MIKGRTKPRGGQVLPSEPFERIVVATDFSEGAGRALEYACTLARQVGARLTLAHVIPVDAFRFLAPNSSASMLEAAKRFAESELERLKSSPLVAGIECTTRLLEGSVARQLTECIQSEKADLVALGTRRAQTGFELALGSVAEEMYRAAPCSVLTVGPGVDLRRAEEAKVHQLVFATNFKPHAERAGDVAYRLERSEQARLKVMHVVEGEDEAATGRGLVEEFLIRRMKKNLPAECFGYCEPDFEVRFGKPADEILDVAKQADADLILLGVRGGRHKSGELPSAVAYQVVCQATCPVLTLHR